MKEPAKFSAYLSHGRCYDRHWPLGPRPQRWGQISDGQNEELSTASTDPDLRYDLTSFGLSEMIRCGAAVRRLGADAGSVEEVAMRLASFFYESLTDAKGAPAAALVRVYTTQPCVSLESELRTFAQGVLADGELIGDATQCLTLLGTRGDDPAWNSRADSQGHKAIPLPSADIVARFPMVAQLVQQLGIEVNALVQRDQTLIIDAAQRAYNVFFVESALGSPHIPAQEDFVVPYRIESVIGFGGLLPNGNLFAVILFLKVKVSADVADLFRTVALNVKLALLPASRGLIFTPRTSGVRRKEGS